MKRSKHSLSNYKLLSLDMGELVPCGMYETLPGDTVQQSTNCLMRVAPLLAPVMHPVHVRIHHFFVPYRIIWEDWENFITGGPDGNDQSVFPTITLTPAAGTLADYLGLPLGTEIDVSALPFRAYAMIWNEWFRDQDLQNELGLSVASGPDGTTNTDMVNVAWEKDYFTSSRPWEQKGPAITVPLGDEAPVTGIGTDPAALWADGASVRETDGAGTEAYAGAEATSRTNSVLVEEDPNNAGFPNIRADLTAATGATVNLLREAFALQRYEEARARYGSRYVEYLRYLGVRSSDARLQRPEYLGGGKQTIQFSEVLQTAPTDDDSTNVGELRGHGIAAVRSNRYRRFFEEHGVVMSFLSVRPKTIYQQGIPRMFNRRIKEDFWQKELQHIGQQSIPVSEIFAAAADPDATFGFQDRYDEYRRIPSTVAGEFRESVLNFWHYAREFASEPALNADFVECVPTERTFAVSTNDVLYTMAHHSIQARRMVAKTGRSFIF